MPEPLIRLKRTVLEESATSRAFASAPRKQLVVLCDGTSNTLTGGTRDTNVLRLYELLALQTGPQTPRRILHYDPGVGAPDGVPGTDLTERLTRLWARISGLAFGRGIFENIGQAYAFLCRNYQPDDDIFVFGFSRGAFTARSVAGMVHLFGLISPVHEHLIPTLTQVYFGSSDADVGRRSVSRGDVAIQVRRVFSSASGRDAWIHFLGVWDTVATVGLWPFDLEITSRATVSDKRFSHVRHALSLDEHRVPFSPRLFSEDNFRETDPSGSTRLGRSLDQRWFRGVHCDVGGGYPRREAGRSTATLQWMLDEANACGMAAPTQLPSRYERVENHDVLAPPPIWAFAGLTVRDTRHARGTSSGDRVPLRPMEAPIAYRRCADRWVWSVATWRPAAATGLWILLAAVMAVAAGGRFDLRAALAAIESGQTSRAVTSALGNWARAVSEPPRWILSGGLPTLSAEDVPPTSTVLALDLLPMLVLAWVFARSGTRSFSLWAGTRRVRARRPRLAMLGRAIPAFTLTSVVGAVLGSAALELGTDVWGRPLRYLAAGVAVLKGIALLGCVGLVGLRLLPPWGRHPLRRVD